MILCKYFPEKEFATQEELFLEIKKNKSFLIAQKKSAVKYADAVFYSENKNDVLAVAKTISKAADSLDATLIINTTKLLDSHNDVHIDGLWTKNVKENPTKLLLQEHKMAFNFIISDTVTPSVKNFTWKQLGFNYKGVTEALVFNTSITKDRNEFMFSQYAKGYVKEHSVGMQYVKLFLAINSEHPDLAEEKQIWDKYYPEIVNQDKADENGYFWAITEAKAIEGSAVVKGSNYATPTLDVHESKEINTNEPLHNTQNKNRRMI